MEHEERVDISADDLTKRQQRYLLKAFELKFRLWPVFVHQDVGKALGLDQHEDGDTISRLVALKVVNVGIFSHEILTAIYEDDEETFFKYAPDGRNKANVLVQVMPFNDATHRRERYVITAEGRELARHLLDENAKERWVWTWEAAKLVWPVVVALLVTYCNNRLYGIKPAISPELKGPAVPAVVTPDIPRTRQAPAMPTTPEKPQRGVNEMAATVPAVPIGAPATQR